jgi:hypothetical protein
MITFAIEDWLLERLLTFNAGTEDFEEGSDGEPDADAEEDGPPVVVDFVRPKIVERRQALASACD